MKDNRKKGPTLLYVTFCIIIVLFSACGSEPETSFEASADTSTNNTGSIAFSVEWRGAPTVLTPKSAISARALDCTAAGVSRVQANVYDENNSQLAGGGPWDCEAHQGTITGVPVGSNRKVVVLGKDDSDNVVYRGEITGVTVTAGQTTNAGTIVADLFNPTLLAPEDGSTVQNGAFSFEWNTIAGASEYQIQVSMDSSFPTTTIDTTITSTIYAPSELSYGVTFFWRVMAKDSYGNQSIWSEVWSLTVSTEPGVAPSTPTNVIPTPGDRQVSIRWEGVSGATSYNIYWARSAGVSKSNYEGKIEDITTTSYTHTGLTNGTTYYYVITAQNSYGESNESNEASATPTEAGTGIATTAWELTNGPWYPTIYDISVHPDNSDNIVVLTSDYITSSVDGGLNFSIVADKMGPTLFRHPTDPELLFAGKLRSQDGGQTWSEMDYGFMTFTAASSFPDTIYACEELDGTRVYQSTDRGINWSLKGTLPDSCTTYPFYQMANDATDINTVYIIVNDNWPYAHHGQLYKSDDCGATWQNLSSLLPTDIFGITADPILGSVIIMNGQDGIYRSADKGTTWSKMLSPSDSPYYDVSRILIDPINNNRMWASRSTSFYYSSDAGASWSNRIHELSGHALISVAFNVAGALYAADRFNIRFSEDNGLLWDPITVSGVAADIEYVKAHPTDSNVVYTGNCCSGPVFKTEDGGDSWSKINDAGINGIFLHPTNPDHVYLLKGPSLLESLDAGTMWSDLGDYEAQTGIEISDHASAFSFSPDDPNTIYIGAGGYDIALHDDPTTWGRVFMSNDGGQLWDYIPFEEPNQAIVGVFARSGDPQTILVTTSDTGLYRTTDGGAIWNKVSSCHVGGGGHHLSPRMVIDPENPDRIFYATQDCFLVSNNFGLTWEEKSGTPEGQVNVLVTYPVANVTRIFVTAGGGLYVSDDLGDSWTRVEIGLDVELDQVSSSSDGTLYAATRRHGVIKGKASIPAVSSLDPNSGTEEGGTIVTITGIHFGETQGTGSVKFNWVPATIASWTETMIVCEMPPGTGSVSLILTTDRRARVILSDAFTYTE